MLKESKFFQNVSFEVSNYTKVQSYEANMIIFNEGDCCEHISIIISGEVLISTITRGEKEEVINRLNPGDAFGDVLAFTTTPTYLGDIIALKKTQIAHINTSTFFNLLKSDEIFLQNYLNHLCDNSLKVKLHDKLISHKNINDRLLYYFKMQIPNDNNTVTIQSVQHLANILNLPRPSVSRALSKLEREGLIKKTGNIITLLDSY